MVAHTQQKLTHDNPWNCRLPQNTARTSEQVKAHFLANRAVTESGCWEWSGALSKSGYGKFKWKGRHLRTHRVAAHLWLGFDLDDERLICHRCDNRKCFNPEHLFAGTERDNQRDCVSKGRHHLAKKTHCKHGHEFDEENTYITKSGNRHCRKCHLANETRRYYTKVKPKRELECGSTQKLFGT